MKILKIMRKVRSVSTFHKTSKYFFKNVHIIVNFTQNLKKIFSNFSRSFPNTFSRLFQNFNFFLQISFSQLLRSFYWKILQTVFYQTFHINFSKISSEVSVILSNFSQNFSRISSILKGKIGNSSDNFIYLLPIILISLSCTRFTDKDCITIPKLAPSTKGFAHCKQSQAEPD